MDCRAGSALNWIRAGLQSAAPGLRRGGFTVLVTGLEGAAVELTEDAGVTGRSAHAVPPDA